MYRYDDPQSLLRTVREQAALTQRELADRVGVAQSVVARLERAPDANPTVRTVSELAEAAGFRLRVVVEPVDPPDPVVEAYKRDVDRTSLRDNLRTSIEQRVRSLGEWQVAMAAMRDATRAASRARRAAVVSDSPYQDT